MGFILFSLIRKLIKTFIKLSLYLAVFAAVIVLIPNLPPYTKFSCIELEPTKPRVGPLAPNEVLNNPEKLYKGKLLGPEAFQLLNGELYTSLATGEIVKISPGGHVTFVTKIGLPCSGLLNEHICGRPLGFEIDESGKSMYIVDTYYGIWKVDLKTDKKQLLVSPRVEIENRQPKLLNSIALHKNGDFFWTDSSSDYQLKDGASTVLTDPSGRLFRYNAAKNESEVLLDNLWFPNGVALSPDNQFLVVSESHKYRLIKYYIAGPNKGKTEVFIDGLPGVPDNVRPLPDGSGLLVGLYIVFDESEPLVSRTLAATPVVRKLVARLQRLVEIPFEYLNTVYPHHLFEEVVYHIGHFKSASAFVPKQSGLLHLDWNGNIVGAYYSSDGQLEHISDAVVFNDKLYTGNPHVQDFIGAVPAPPALKKAFATKKTENAPKVTKPAEPKREQPKVEKPKVEASKPKVEEKREAPKVAKPVASEAKPAQKPAEPLKQAQKPTEPKPTTTTPPPPKAEPKKVPPPTTTPKPVTTTPPPKPTEKPTTPPPKPAQKATPAPPKPTEKPSTPQKPTEKPTTPPPKPTQKPTTPPPKPTQKATPPPQKPTPAAEPKKQEAKPQKPVNAKAADDKVIPIKEDIPSDTAKPSTKEPLRVIKKGGPIEIPAPNQ